MVVSFSLVHKTFSTVELITKKLTTTKIVQIEERPCRWGVRRLETIAFPLVFDLFSQHHAPICIIPKKEESLGDREQREIKGEKA